MRARQKNRIRKSTKYAYIIIAVVLLITSLSSLGKNLSEENVKTRTKEIYNYTNKFDYDYKVNLIENKFMKNEEITDKTIAYVTDLIDTTDFKLNYEYIADKESDLQCTYSVIGKMQVVYTKDGEEQKIWEKEETVLEEKQLNEYSDKISINENLSLDLKEKNDLLAEFKQQMGMTVDAQYTITLKINVKTTIEDKEVNSDYNPTIQVDLAEKTSKISGENNLEDTQYISKEYNVSSPKNVFIIIIDAILLVIAIALLKYVTKSKATNRVRNEFRQELNRILKICQDKIVQVRNKPVDKTGDVVLVKDFGEIVKVSEELFKPILYYFDVQKEEAWFSVMSGNTTYRYILKR